ncbi:hypothetical protein [Xenorhabdus griffiniae]|uniref:hypothetical protein n=1 Tax=Xenorhabdus griffiniae TaxID=351672 RepID=UPI002359D657|nr:hypothetical protein [Xenorhabdus griffiniae]MDC9605636.1 hypothetical protein [Xenorhabdus griffiniae]
MIKEIYGVKIFPLVVMFYQIRRWWVLRVWRKYWHSDQYVRKQVRYSKRLSDEFSFERSYRLLKLFIRTNQKRGII